MNEALDRLDPQFGPPADLAILDASAAKIGFEVPGPLGPRRMRPRFATIPARIAPKCSSNPNFWS